ncbi:MAG TPA: hypothetical protein DD362_06690 [Roseburia sp.]|nr:hypothetical protein [Roseburia sp.]
MKNYNILIVFILISILSGCGGKNYLGEKIVVSTTNLRLIEDNNSFLEQIGQIIESQQEQGEESEEIEKEENASKDEDSFADNITGSSDSVSLNQMEIGEVLKECNKILQDSYSVSTECQVIEGSFYLEKDGNLLGRYAAKSEFIIFDKVNDKKYQISLDGMEKSVEIKEIKESESTDTMQAMPWDAVLEMVNALDFDTIAEPEDDYILLNLAGEVEVGSNGINPASGKNKKFYTIENGTMVSADQQMIRGKQYALELTGATNKDGNALTAGSQIVVKHVAGVFLKCQ